MKTINFKRFEMPTDVKDISSIQIADVRKDAANQIYRNGTTIEEKRLAEKIYDSDGEIELSDEEAFLLETVSKRSAFNLPFQDAVSKALNGI